MPFRIQKTAKDWFKHLSHKDVLSIDFDIYYLCLMAGLADKKKADISTSETNELVDYFPDAYKARGRIIIALFLSRELKALGILFTERTALHKEISNLVDPQSPSRLSNEGMNEMNKYCYGGFETIANYFGQRFIDPPRNLETFLPMYKKLIGDVIKD